MLRGVIRNVGTAELWQIVPTVADYHYFKRVYPNC